MAIQIQDNAPPPLDALEHVVIDPANQELERRYATATKLTLKQRVQAWTDHRKLTKQLKRSNWSGIKRRRRELKQQIVSLKDRWTASEDKPDELKQQIISAVARWRGTNAEYQKLVTVAKARRRVVVALDNHKMAVQRDKLHKIEYKGWLKEAKIYERLIRLKWTALGFAYRYVVGDKHKVDEVQFADVTITEDAIYYRIDAAYETAFKAWRSNMPQGIRIVKDLLAPETLDELTITCQRQVTGVWSPNGAWVVVHRLDAADGLLNRVDYDAVIEYYPRRAHQRMPICLGVAQHRKVKWINLGDYPHWLIGGLSGGGKSNFINNMLSTLITTQSPKDLRLILIDLKGGLEFSDYEGIPHLAHDIVTSVEAVAATLAQIEGLMHQRFLAFKGKARSLEVFNAKNTGVYMPRIAIVFDEVASVMSQGGLTQEIHNAMRSLARMGRAVGIHLFLCTQRPDVGAVPGDIKANMAAKISGRMPTHTDSATILGNGLAAQLAAIPGRMIVQLGVDVEQVQTPHVTDDHIAAAVAAAHKWPAPPALELPDIHVKRERWTVERVIDFAITHNGGQVSGRPIYEAIGDSSVTRQQIYDLCEQAWQMESVAHGGVMYGWTKRGRAMYLTRLDNPEILNPDSE